MIGISGEETDDTCRLILLVLLTGPKEYAELQRAINAGSYKTVKRHVEKHLLPAKLVSLKEKNRGLRTYYLIGLTEEGRNLVKKIKGA